MRKYTLIFIVIKTYIFLSCSNEDQKLISTNTIIYNDTLNTKVYPFKDEYNLFLKSERLYNDSLKKENPQLIVIDPKYTTPLPITYVLNQNGQKIPLKTYIKEIENNTDESVYCNIEYWIEWDNRLSYIEILRYKGEKPNQQFIMEIFDKIKFEQKEFKKNFPYPRSKIIWIFRINTKNYLYEIIRNLFYIISGILILIYKPASTLKVIYSRKIELILGFGLLISGAVLFLNLFFYKCT